MPEVKPAFRTVPVIIFVSLIFNLILIAAIVFVISLNNAGTRTVNQESITDNTEPNNAILLDDIQRELLTSGYTFIPDTSIEGVPDGTPVPTTQDIPADTTGTSETNTTNVPTATNAPSTATQAPVTTKAPAKTATLKYFGVSYKGIWTINNQTYINQYVVNGTTENGQKYVLFSYLLNTSLNGQAQFSPDGKMIAYQDNDGIYIYNTDTQARTLVTTDHFIKSSNWSWDSTKIAFLLGSDSNAVWKVYNPANNSLNSLALNIPSSPNGSGLVFGNKSNNFAFIAFEIDQSKTKTYVGNMDNISNLQLKTIPLYCQSSHVVFAANDNIVHCTMYDTAYDLNTSKSYSNSSDFAFNIKSNIAFPIESAATTNLKYLVFGEPMAQVNNTMTPTVYYSTLNDFFASNHKMTKLNVPAIPEHEGLISGTDKPVWINNSTLLVKVNYMDSPTHGSSKLVLINDINLLSHSTTSLNTKVVGDGGEFGYGYGNMVIEL